LIYEKLIVILTQSEGFM